ncbi:MAG: helix-turn-helix transcriptional regulator [Candidatus Gastranaerophilales bacterium]|nr:helix-turn-helix transcriptional regulator [Candidatus Gastranaerophilales bacterium]MCM1072399.1 helix-turn-helix transcriptional regulator [Bacteroides sp.]
MTNSTLEILRKNLRYYRKLKNLSQEKLGELTDISKDYLSEIERGKKTPSIKRLIIIADALDTEVYKFFINNDKLD